MPVNKLKASVEVFDDRRATFNPVTGIVVEDAVDLAHLSVMNVTADHTINTLAASFGRKRVLEIADEVDSLLDFQLEVLRERPVGSSELAPDVAEERIRIQRQRVGCVAEVSEPLRVHYDAVELITMDDEKTLAVSSGVHKMRHYLYATGMQPKVVAEKFVVIAGHVDDPRTLANFAQQLLHHVVVCLRPEPAFAQAPAVNDVADEIDGVGVVVSQEIEQHFCLTATRSQVSVGEHQGPPTLHTRFILSSVRELFHLSTS